MNVFREPISTEGAANRFREPAGELPEWIRLNFIRDLLHTRQSTFDLEEAEALLEVLLDICPDADDAVDNYLHRKGLIASERQRP